MDRVKTEKQFWNEAALDPNVDRKYISDILFDLPLVVEADKVLDLGCGVGRLMRNRKNYYGVDISENMLKIAKERNPECIFKLGDGRTIPFPNETFDYAYCILLFQHLPFEAVASYMAEVKRVLKHDGRFLFQYIQGNENEPFSKHFPAPLIEDEMESLGFAKVYEKSRLIHDDWTWIEAVKP